MIGRTLAMDTLRSSDLGTGLAAGEIDKLMGIGQVTYLQPGVQVVRQLDPADAVYLPCSGTVIVERSSIKGRRQVIGFLYRGDYLGFTSTRNYLYSAATLEECTLLKFKRGQFNQLCDRVPQLKENVAHINNMVLTSLMDHLFAIGQKRAHERLGFLIYQLYLRQGQPANQVPVSLPMSRTDIGDYLGLTLETTSRAFSRLRDEKIIRTPDHHSVIIDNLEAIQVLADVD